MKYYKVLSFFGLLIMNQYVLAQNVNSITPHLNFSGNASLTNNGISIIPAFSLNKPAAIIDMSIGNERLSFEPYLGFSLEGNPWTFLFWGKYKLKQKGKFTINTGVHYGLAFSSVPFVSNGISTPMITAQRYLAGELVPNYAISKHVSAGVYYLYSHGLDSYAIPNTNFVAFYSSFNKINLTKKFFLNFTPQFYYLNLNGIDGFYFSSIISLCMKDFPVSISYQFNKVINTNITGSPNFTGRASIVYSFNSAYAKHK